MRCTECEAQLPPGVEFCPQCGTPTSERLRERRTAVEADDELKAKRRNYFLIGAAFVFGLAIGNQTGWWSSDFEIDHHEREGRPVFAQAQALFEAYQDDEEEADEKFGDRGIVVTGEFVRVVNDDGGNPDLRLKTSDPEMPLGADLLENSHDEAAQLQPGQTVTVSCERVAETDDEHWLQNCSIEEVVPTESAAPASAPKSKE